MISDVFVKSCFVCSGYICLITLFLNELVLGGYWGWVVGVIVSCLFIWLEWDMCMYSWMLWFCYVFDVSSTHYKILSFDPSIPTTSLLACYPCNFPSKVPSLLFNERVHLLTAKQTLIHKKTINLTFSFCTHAFISVSLHRRHLPCQFTINENSADNLIN